VTWDASTPTASYIVERKKDSAIRAGVHIYPRDVEETPYANPRWPRPRGRMPDPVMGEEVRP